VSRLSGLESSGPVQGVAERKKSGSGAQVKQPGTDEEIVTTEKQARNRGLGLLGK
jgi:hypothetical protein